MNSVLRELMNRKTAIMSETNRLRCRWVRRVLIVMVNRTRTPVMSAQRWSIVFAWSLVKNGQQLVGLTGQHFQVYYGISSVAFKRRDHQIPLKVTSVEPRQRKAITISGQWGRIDTRNGRLRCCRVHVVKEHITEWARDTTTHIADLKDNQTTRLITGLISNHILWELDLLFLWPESHGWEVSLRLRGCAPPLLAWHSWTVRRACDTNARAHRPMRSALWDQQLTN